MTVSPYYEPIGAIKERVEEEKIHPPVNII
jgi:hypothetical protein